MPSMRVAAIPLSILVAPAASAAVQPAAAKPYQVEWVYRVRYGFQDEWWCIFQKYQIAALDEEQRRGYVQHYEVVRPSLHTSEEYRIVITYNGYDGSTHESDFEQACLIYYRSSSVNRCDIPGV